MKLAELFPDLIKIKIQGKEYELKYGTRALLQMEKDYPDRKEREKLITMSFADDSDRPQIVIGSTTDLINLLHAGLLHTKAFSDKEVLTDAIEPRDFNDYVNAVFAAFMQARATPEQLEKLQVMAEANGAKKNEAKETSPVSGLSTESSAG